MADKIIIGADLDTSAVEKKLSELERKVKGMRETGPGGALSQLSQEYRSTGQEERAQRLEEFRKRTDAQNRKGLLKDLESQEKELDKQIKKYEKISELQKNLREGGQAYNKSLEVQADTLEKINQMTKQINEGRSVLQPQGGGRDYGEGFGPFSGRDLEFMRRGMGGGRGIRGGIGAMARTIGRNPLMMMGMLGSGLGAAGSALEYGGNLAYQIGTRGERQERAQAGIAGGLSELAQLQANRRGYEMQLFGEERMRAMEAASNRRTFSEARDITGTAGSVLSSTGAGIGVGAGIGGLLGGGIGALIGGVGMVPGAMLGAKAGGAIGGLFGFGKGVGGTLTDDTRRSMLFERDFYDQIKTQEQFRTYQEQLEIQKAQSFEKAAAQEYFENNADQFRGMQRQFGLSDEELFLGPESIFQRGARSGFNTDTISRSMQAISAGGGTTAASQQGAILASQLERGMDLTNAGQLIGRISGATGMDDQQSTDSLIRMYAEATRIGLDASEYAKETRKFLETAANMAYESGADFDTVANMLGQGVGLKSERGIQAAQNALEQLQQETGQMGGLTGQYQIGELQSEALTQALGGQRLNLEETAMVMGMDVSRVSLKDDYIKTLLERRGIDLESDEAKNVIKEIRSGKIKSTLRNPDQEEAYKNFQRVMEDPQATEQERREAESRVRELGIFSGGKSEARRGILEQQFIARLKAGLLTGQGKTSQEMIDYTRQNIEARMSGADGRLGDRRERAQAQDDLAQLNRLSQNAGKLGEAFDNTTEKSIRLAEAIAKLAENVDENEKVFSQYSAKIKEILESPQVQGSSGGFVNIQDILNNRTNTQQSSNYGNQE